MPRPAAQRRQRPPHEARLPGHLYDRIPVTAGQDRIRGAITPVSGGQHRPGRHRTALYRPDGRGGYHRWAMQVLETDGSLITGLHAYVFPELFTYFGFAAAL